MAAGVGNPASPRFESEGGARRFKRRAGPGAPLAPARDGLNDSANRPTMAHSRPSPRLAPGGHSPWPPAPQVVRSGGIAAFHFGVARARPAAQC